MPTHEPFPYHFDKIITFVGGSPSPNDNIPGTPEWVANQNRLAGGIRGLGQLQADLEYEIQKQGLGQVQTAVNKVTSTVKSTVGSATSIQKFADEYVKGYTKKWGLPENILNPVTPLATGVNEIVNQTIKSVTGDAVNLLKDQVLINQAGNLFTTGNLGQAVSGNVSNVIGDLTSKSGVFTTAGDILSKSINIPGFGSADLKNLSNLSTVTDTYKNIMGGNITSVTQLTSLVNNIGSNISSTIASVGRSIGKIFGW
jgi:hypothetical protein